jgi:DNA invertase Pin-like site-specific DNA recombinase
VSTADQTTDNQLIELRRYVEVRGWTVVEEFIDHGISGTKASRPALDRMLMAARRRQIDGVVRWKLDRIGRNTKHLILLLDELQALSVAFVSLQDSIDATTPVGKMAFTMLAAFAEFERATIVERVRAGLGRARRQGKVLGRPRRSGLTETLRAAVAGLSTREAAGLLGVSQSTAAPPAAGPESENLVSSGLSFACFSTRSRVANRADLVSQNHPFLDSPPMTAGRLLLG